MQSCYTWDTAFPSIQCQVYIWNCPPIPQTCSHLLDVSLPWWQQNSDLCHQSLTLICNSTFLLMVLGRKILPSVLTPASQESFVFITYFSLRFIYSSWPTETAICFLNAGPLRFLVKMSVHTILFGHNPHNQNNAFSLFNLQRKWSLLSLMQSWCIQKHTPIL